MIKIKITNNDTQTVAKAVIIDEKNRILFLKRSDYLKKFAGEWDLPGGHLKEGESLIQGLEREVFEETALQVRDPEMFKELENLNFFYVKYDSQEVKLSHEHTDYKFFEREELNPSEKFQKVALQGLEVYHANFNNQKRNQ